MFFNAYDRLQGKVQTLKNSDLIPVKCKKKYTGKLKTRKWGKRYFNSVGENLPHILNYVREFSNS
jgi:hypothetical protein